MTAPSANEAGSLGRELVSAMDGLTKHRHLAMALENAKRNHGLAHHGASIRALLDESIGSSDSALVVAAGPSIKRQDPAKSLLKNGYDGALVCTESALFYLLRNDLVPDLVVTVDPHANRIVRWLGDPNLTHRQLQEDDYYRRQDMDEAFEDELRVNAEVLELVDRYGPQIRIAVSTSASEAVVTRVLQAGMKIYWWNPMLDDPDAEGESTTRDLIKANGFPAVNAGGNVGTASWMLAGAVLKKSIVGLVGVDFGYYADTPYNRTQYYKEILELVGEDGLESVFMKVRNPHLGDWFYTDPAYMWYREAFLSMAADAEWETYNCTGGGILFGNSVNWERLEHFISQSKS